jgi:hypothetical protein
MANVLDRKAVPQLDHLEEGEEGDGPAHSSENRQDEHLQGRVRFHGCDSFRQVQFPSRTSCVAVPAIDRQIRLLEQKHGRCRSTHDGPRPIVFAGFTVIISVLGAFAFDLTRSYGRDSPGVTGQFRPSVIGATIHDFRMS